MRFSAPRSDSPEPARRQARPPPFGRSTFGVPSDSSDESSDAESEASTSSSDSFCFVSESEIPKPSPLSTVGLWPQHTLMTLYLFRRAQRPDRSITEQHNIEDMLAAIRLRVAHHDVYEEWEHKTRKDAYVTARQEQAIVQEGLRHNAANSQHQFTHTQAALHQRQLDEVQSKMTQFRGIQQQQELKLRSTWQERNSQLWQRIEGVIKLEEDRVKAKLEMEQRKKEEEERKRQEAETKKRLDEERKLQETLRQRKEQQEKEAQKAKEEEQKAKEEAEQRQRVEQEAQKSVQNQAQEQERKSAGMTTAAEDWKKGRELLKKLKNGPMKTVKGDKQMKSVWSAGRRAITPKIGQLTNDAESINRITKQIVDVMRPPVPHPKPIYFALLSSLSKAVLLQAETEVTAEKRSAIPLAQVTANLLGTLERFADIFWAKLCQRAGGWPVPHVIPAVDVDDTPFDAASRRKALGYRGDESSADYSTRVAGIMRVYFHVLGMPSPQPLDPRFRVPRYWTYFARIASEPTLLDTPVAPEIISTALDVAGANAREIWGTQWVKLLAVLYEGVTTGINGEQGRLIGGKTAEGTAARVRVQLEIERIMSAL